METERKLMTLVFVVIISNAAITVVGMLTMIVLEKRKAAGDGLADCAILDISVRLGDIFTKTGIDTDFPGRTAPAFRRD